MRFLLLVLALVAAVPRNGDAQAPDPACDYERCALGVLPRLTALDVVRGREESRVASLSFLWPRDPGAPFGDNAASREHITAALRLRRVAAVLTDLGMGALTGGGALAASGHSRHLSIALALGGAATLGASVPVQFSADAELSRAVWEYNRRFMR